MAKLFSVAVVMLVAFLGAASAFTVSPTAARAVRLHKGLAPTARPSSARPGLALRMSEEEEAATAVAEVEEVEAEAPPVSGFRDANFFSPNQNFRYGASRDQDGKSNIWAIEPQMEVQGKDEGEGDNKLVVAGGLIAAGLLLVAGTVALLPQPDTL